MACLICGRGRSGEASVCVWIREQRTRRGMCGFLSMHHYSVAAVGDARSGEGDVVFWTCQANKLFIFKMIQKTTKPIPAFSYCFRCVSALSREEAKSACTTISLGLG